MKHKSRLMGIKEEKMLTLTQDKVREMKISDYMVDVAPSPDMAYADALILAMKKEKKAFQLYTYLSEQVASPLLKGLFLTLAPGGIEA